MTDCQGIPFSDIFTQLNEFKNLFANGILNSIFSLVLSYLSNYRLSSIKIDKLELHIQIWRRFQIIITFNVITIFSFNGEQDFLPPIATIIMRFEPAIDIIDHLFIGYASMRLVRSSPKGKSNIFQFSVEKKD